MPTMTMLRIVIASVVVLCAGCSKKQETPATGSGSGSAKATGPDTGSSTGSSAGSAVGSGSDSGSSMASGSGSGSAAGSGSDAAGSAAGSGSATAEKVTPIKNDQDYVTRDLEATDRVVAVFVAAGKDCAKLAKDLNKFIDDNAGLQKEIEVYEKAHPKARDLMKPKMKAKEKEMTEKMSPVMEACGEDKAVEAAMARLK
jgi:hypothetical protein